MATSSNPRPSPGRIQGSANLADLRASINTTRSTFTRLRGTRRSGAESVDTELQPDFITLVSLVCNLYRNREQDLVPIQQFHAADERYEGKGSTSVVSHRAIKTTATSLVKRGTTSALKEDIVVKRPLKSVLVPDSRGFRSFLNELRIRTHQPIRRHPNIVAFKGVAWDFEEGGTSKPRPLLLEELAPQGSLEAFWGNYNFIRTTFQAKVDLSLDIADGLAVLHACHIVHGDVKPDNILIFPRIGHKDSFMAKLTDFGHSVAKNEGLKALPGYTPQWTAPEVANGQNFSFEDMIATDVYSYGLVLLSVMLGRSYHRDLEDVEVLKRNDAMFDEAMKLIEKEDRQNHDSDFELDILQPVLLQTLKHSPQKRNLRRCMRILQRYKAAHARNLFFAEIKKTNNGHPLKVLDVSQEICIGYQSLALCSHQLRSRIVEDLRAIAQNDQDPRQALAAWELVICFYSAFGVVEKDIPESSRWLSFARDHGVLAAETSYKSLHEAFDLGCMSTSKVQKPAAQKDTSAHSVLDALPEPQPLKNDDGASPGGGANQRRREHDKQSRGLSVTGVEELQYDSDLASSLSDSNREEVAYELADDMINAAVENDAARLSKLLFEDPNLLNSQDASGDTLLTISAREESTDVLDMLLHQDGIDASKHNHLGQSALHLTATWSESSITAYVPQLIARDCDPFHEAMPIQYRQSLLDLSAGMRCCPVFGAVLRNNLPLLRCLLKEAHKSSASACRVCEAGSRLRRIVAVALSTFRADALGIVVHHIESFTGQAIDLSSLMVWSNRQLVPLLKAPFQSSAIEGADLPEDFFRAVSYGRGAVASLQMTLSFLFDRVCHTTEQLHDMLSEAVTVDSLEAVNIVLDEGHKRGLPAFWWVQSPNKACLGDPLRTAIKFGRRQIFHRLFQSCSTLFQNEFPVAKADFYSMQAWLFIWLFFLDGKGYVSKKAVNSVNLAHICLSIAVTAPHQDHFFLHFILEHGHRQQIIKQPTVSDRRFADQSSCFLAEAILASAFPAAQVLSDRFPELWSHRTAENSAAGQSRFIRHFPKAYLVDHDSNLPVRHLDFLDRCMERLTGEVTQIRKPSVTEYIFLVGSYEQCCFVLRNIRSQRLRKHLGWLQNSAPTLSHSSAHEVESGGPDWMNLPLSMREYFCLLLGNLVCELPDRQELWQLIAKQVHLGKPKWMSCIYIALENGNTYGLQQLLELGWPVNGPSRLLVFTPLAKATDIEKTAGQKINQDRMSNSKNTAISTREEQIVPQWGNLDSHKQVFRMFQVQQAAMSETFGERSKENSKILRENGGRISLFVRFWSRERNIWGAAIVYIAVMFGAFPVLLAYKSAPHWAWRNSFVGHLVFSYFWAIGITANVFALVEGELYIGRIIPGIAFWVIQFLIVAGLPLLLVYKVNFAAVDPEATDANSILTWLVLTLIEVFATGGLLSIFGFGMFAVVFPLALLQLPFALALGLYRN